MSYNPAPSSFAPGLHQANGPSDHTPTIKRQTLTTKWHWSSAPNGCLSRISQQVFPPLYDGCGDLQVCLVHSIEKSMSGKWNSDLPRVDVLDVSSGENMCKALPPFIYPGTGTRAEISGSHLGVCARRELLSRLCPHEGTLCDKRPDLFAPLYCRSCQSLIDATFMDVQPHGLWSCSRLQLHVRAYLVVNRVCTISRHK